MKKKEKIFLIGGGGHCKSVIDAIESQNKYDIHGIIDLPEKVGESIYDYKVIGSDDKIEELIKEGMGALITIGHLGFEKELRSKYIEIINSYDAWSPIIIAKSGHVSPYALIKEGTVVLNLSVINASAEIGEHCIINTSSVVEHDVKIGSNSHLAPMSVISGDSILGENVFLGANSCIKHSISVADRVTIGAMSYVNKNIESSGEYIGTPVSKRG